MSRTLLPARRESRRRPLALCIASIFALCAPAAAMAATWTVDSCDGDDASTGNVALKTGTLRFAVANASNDDIVELGPLSCPSSKISLTTGGYIAVLQPKLTIRGSAGSVLTIDASALPAGDIAYSNIFYHSGGDTLKIQDLALTGGHVNHQYIDAKGGCIYSKANVVLDHVSVSSCSAHSQYDSAKGGGVYVKGNLTLYDSTVSGSSATAAATASGGGAFAKGNLTLQFSTLSGNKADGSQSLGGGAYSHGDFLAGYSTVSGNAEYGPGYGGGLDLHGKFNTISSSTISGNVAYGASGGVEVSSQWGAGSTFLVTNSTISGNHAESFTGGLRVDSSIARFYNSTIAFNTAKLGAPTSAAGVQLQEDFNVMAATLEGNLISNNTYGSNESDLGEFVPPGFSIEINGGLAAVPAHNLIRAGSVIGLPTDTSSACPLLGRLRDNGGLTRTHALLSHSPAIDAGNNAFLASYDQRGAALINGTFDYLRLSGPIGDPNPQADIGAYEVQQDDAVFSTDFEGCP